MIHRILVVIAAVVALLAGQALTSPSRPAIRSAFYDLGSAQQLATAYSPDQLETAYDFSPLYSRSLDGTGQTVALVELDAYDSADFQAFDARYSLPDPSISEYYVGGQTFEPQSDAETTMDVEWLHALAPGAAIQIYYLDPNQSTAAGWRSMASALRMAAAHGVGVVSISLGACGTGSGASATRSALAQLMQAGISVFVASGDSGAHPGPKRQCGNKVGVGYPSGDPSVVSVGGTSLQLNDDDTIAAEAAWRLSGGGRITTLLRPSWEAATSMPNDRYRWAPDVAFLGNPNTGASIYFDGRWHEAGGTSLGAPAWAALWALVRQSASQAGLSVGAAPPLLYAIGNSASYKQAFHDVVSGSNGKYRARPGWDAVTGWGTPDATGLTTAVQTVRLPG
jgi:kumamolisin